MPIKPPLFSDGEIHISTMSTEMAAAIWLAIFEKKHSPASLAEQSAIVLGEDEEKLYKALTLELHQRTIENRRGNQLEPTPAPDSKPPEKFPEHLRERREVPKNWGRILPSMNEAPQLGDFAWIESAEKWYELTTMADLANACAFKDVPVIRWEGGAS